MPGNKNDVPVRDLGDGLILRRANREDADALSMFNARMHSDDGLDKPDERVAVWTRDLLEKPHPTFKVEDFTVVEDTRKGEIVSSMNLIPQTWRYGDIPFKVDRPELVGTHPDYRGRGLVRAQFEVIHQWSAERESMVQAITGIPYYYRQFGYEMAMNLGGGRDGYKTNVPKLTEGMKEPYVILPAVDEDIPFIVELYRSSQQRYLVSCDWDEALWRYELGGKSAGNVNRMEMRIIKDESGERVGFLVHPRMLWGVAMVVFIFELSPKISWNNVTPSVVRYLSETGEAYAQRDKKEELYASFGFRLGDWHPVYDVMHDSLPQQRKPYAWYLRVPKLPEFLLHIKPVLETRLENSPYFGFTGELRLTFYRQGLKLTFEQGYVKLIEAWNPTPHGHSGEAAFPELTFLQLLFGYRSLDELDHAFADCWWENDQTYGLLNTLFPKQLSDVFPVS